MSRPVNILIATVAIFTSFAIAPASQSTSKDDTAQRIEQTYEQIRQLLSDRGNYREVAGLFHTLIDDQARFTMTLRDDLAPGRDAAQRFTLTKTDYINSYLQGMSFVQDHDLEVQIKDVALAHDGQSATVKETITETGMSVDPVNPKTVQRPFITVHECETKYDVSGKSLKIKGSSCVSTIHASENI